ncbi:MAG: aminotransferase class I/II-fold pyridoxal phosphate-dependent enzyme, partial [bacterium]|nr:aminotransferase class I/II-fold pyridoxal phosphate-dependent enzyme [bacterium]
ELPDNVVVVIDEAYAEYLEEVPDWAPVFESGRPLVVLRTFSKIFGLAALRIGYGRASREIAALLQRARQPFNVNAIAQAGALAALDDADWVEQCRVSNQAGLAQLTEGLRDMEVDYVPSVGNFLLVKVDNGQEAFVALQRIGVIVRPVGVYGLPEWVRVTVGSSEQNSRFLRGLGEWLGRGSG